MSTEFEYTGENIVKKPQVFLKSVTFNDDVQLMLKQNSIIVFTGPNNSGKSQVLKDIEESHLDESNKNSTIVIKSFKCDYQGMIDETAFLKDRFSEDKQGNYLLYETESVFDRNKLKQWWNNHTLYNGLYKLFVKRLSTEIRLTSSNALNRNNQPKKHPIYKLNQSETLAQKICCGQAFL